MPNIPVPVAATGLPKSTRRAVFAGVIPGMGASRTTSLAPDEFPDVYAVTCEGDCLHPLVKDGSKLLFSRDEQYEPGDLVNLILRPEFVKPGQHQMLVKRLVLAPPHRFWVDPSCNARSNIVPTVIVEMLNPKKMMQADPRALLGIHKCLGPVRKGQRTVVVSDAEVRAAAGSIKECV